MYSCPLAVLPYTPGTRASAAALRATAPSASASGPAIAQASRARGARAGVRPRAAKKEALERKNG